MIRRVIGIILVGLIVINMSELVMAATTKELYGINTGYGASNTIVIENYLKRASNSGALSDAINSWNNGFSGSSKRYVLKQGSSLNYVTESDLESKICGQYRVITYYPSKSWRITASFCILIHDDDLNTAYWDTLYGKRKWRSGTLAHELGHAMSLADLDDGKHAEGYGKTSVMSYARKRGSITSPQSIDFSNAKLFK